MSDAVTRALRDCVVALRCDTPEGPQSGSAFYVATHLLVTCQHVVAGAAPVEILVADQWQPVERVELTLPLAADVALLRSTRHSSPFVRLGRFAALGDAVRATGFPRRNDALHEEQILGSIEDVELQHNEPPWRGGVRLLKFRHAQVWPGFSGAPLYAERTRRVVGVVMATRDQHSDLGGIAVPAAVLLDAHAELRDAQRATDWSSTVWNEPRGAETAFLEHYLDPLKSPFFGRAAALAALDHWLASAAPQALLVADAGRGKSALLAHWFRQLRDGDAVFDAHLQIALLPIRFGRAREHEVLADLHRCVAEWHPDLRADDGRSLHDRIVEGLRRPASPGQQRLLLVDGLDETVGWQVDDKLLAGPLGAGVRVLAAARRIAARDLAGWRDQLGWRGASPTAITLDRLGEADTIDAAAQWWGLAATAALPLGQRLFELSQGEPLVLGLYLRSFERAAAPQLESLAALPPGLDGVFEHWLVELAQQRQRDPADAMGTVERHAFNLLACAFEPLPRQVLLAVMRGLGPCSGDELDAALRALARFIVGDASGYALGHPELARWRWRRLQRDGEAQAYDAAFARWLRALLDDDGATAVDSYALRAGTRHLARSGSATLGDWHRVAGDRWRAQHQRSDDWPQGYAADLARAGAAAHAADQADLAANRPCCGLPLRAAVAFARQAIDRLTQRVPASLAAQAARHGLWTSARALQQVLAAHDHDFPRIAALGAIAPQLAAPELEGAMAALALERGDGFDWDDTLGTWELAAAAARSAAFDDATLAHWAQSLPGLGAALALLSLAAASAGDARSRWLAPALKALVATARHTPDRSCLALGVRVAQCFALAELQAGADTAVDAWSCGAWLGFRWDLSRGETAAAALRVAWNWLDADERERCAAALVDRLPRWIEVLQSGQAAALRQADELWSIAHRDWQPRLGAIWDVCSVDLARSVHRQLRDHFASDFAHGSNQRTGFAVMLRFASRLSPDERRFERLTSDVWRWAFAQSSTYKPEVDELFDAAASLPEWSAAFGEQVLQWRGQRSRNAVDVLKIVARHLSPAELDQQWRQVGHFDTDWRDRARRAILAAMAGHGADAVRLALQRADEPDLGLEHQLLEAVLAGLRGGLDTSLRNAARLALAGFRSEDARQAQLLSALAAPLAPWSLDEIAAWVPKDSGHPSLALGWLLPHVRADELCDAETPWRLAIHRAIADTDAATEAAIRTLHAEVGLDATLAWAAAMDEAVAETYRSWRSNEREMERDWTALALCALSQVAADQRDALLRVALALPPAEARAEACAALCSDDDVDTPAWAAVDSALRAAVAMERENSVARILRRLRGKALQRGIELAEVNTRLLLRAGESRHRDSVWADRARALLHWADAALIERDFMPGGRLVDVSSSTDLNLLRGGLAPRLLELGRVDDAMRMAAAVSEPQAWLAHVAMLDHLHDAPTARRFVEAIMATTYSDLSLFAVARELQRGACDDRPAVLREICDALLDAADSDARLRLHLAVSLPLLQRLCGDEGVDAIAARARTALAR